MELRRKIGQKKEERNVSKVAVLGGGGWAIALSKGFIWKRT